MWNNVTTANFSVNFGLRQSSVLSPFLFAIYLDELCKLCRSERSRFIVVYADDIMLISPSVVETERLLHACGWSLDFFINRFFTKLFSTMHTVKFCQDQFGFELL